MNDRHAHLENCKIPKMQNASAHHTRLTTRRDVLKPKVSCTISSHIIWNFCTSPMILSLPLPSLRALPGKKTYSWGILNFRSLPQFSWLSNTCACGQTAEFQQISRIPILICLGTSAGGPSSSLPVLYPSFQTLVYWVGRSLIAAADCCQFCKVEKHNVQGSTRLERKSKMKVDSIK